MTGANSDPARGHRDEGMTLSEVIIGMALATVLTLIMTGAVTHMYRTAKRAESASVSQTQNYLALLRIDRQVRYSYGMSWPASRNGIQYVEFLFSKSGTQSCLQLRVDKKRLQARTWTIGVSGPVDPSKPSQAKDWSTLASGVEPTFTLMNPESESDVHQQLRVVLNVDSNKGSTHTDEAIDITFTALNTNRDSSHAVCLNSDSR